MAAFLKWAMDLADECRQFCASSQPFIDVCLQCSAQPSVNGVTRSTAMNVAVRTDIASALVAPERATRASAARIDVYEDLAAAEPVWRRLEAMGALATPYQRFEWVSLWHRH